MASRNSFIVYYFDISKAKNSLPNSDYFWSFILNLKEDQQGNQLTLKGQVQQWGKKEINYRRRKRRDQGRKGVEKWRRENRGGGGENERVVTIIQLK